MAIASAVSWEAAKLVGSKHPYLAPLSVILCLQTTIDKSIRFSFHRIVGTAIGVMLTAYLVSHLHMNGWILGLLMLGGTYIAKWLRLDETVLHQVALTILLVFTFERTSKDYVIDRIIDTIIGVIIAILIHMLLFPPDFTKKAAETFQTLAHQLSDILLELSKWVQLEWGQGKGNLMEYKMNHLLQELHATKEMLQTASQSVKFNPIRKKHKIILSRYQIQMQKMNAGYEYVSNIAKTLKEWEKEGTLSSSDKMELSNDLKMLSEFFEEFKGIQQGQINDWKHNMLLESLRSKLMLYPPPNHKVYKDSFFLETTKLLKNL
ncbi:MULTISPECIES: FUSC family protein [unclassified Bacillus (in: firmicutes)]|uniref:FUSC family protein n=1 Tax=unclassified Bacillus (in: firmicutes) TaxID=185979 RepID=UPI0025B45C27|nr:MULTISPECIES: FUSC family protein [unclassified Bacillus (in: firmicutes)]MDN0189807.1 FUSC family protein [Bacillus sp. B.PNR1]MDN3034147.1 FUSC family protein [Bacillus sp. B.PNR2]